MVGECTFGHGEGAAARMFDVSGVLGDRRPHMEDQIAYPAHQEAWIIRLAVAAGIGFLIGLEREFSRRNEDTPELQPQFGGLRTFTVIGLLGYLAALFAQDMGAWLLGVVFAGFVALVVTSYVLSSRQGDVGLTTEITALITFLLGALAFDGELLMAVVVGVLVLVLLRFKLELHGFVEKLTSEEVKAIVQFVVITALVLPFLPDEGFGPDEVWNPKEIWMMVVLVSGISLAGYLLTKFLGGRAGTMLSGILGGLASSTAVALGHARRSRGSDEAAPYLALGIVAASSIMFLRMLMELFAVNATIAQRLWVPLLIIACCGIAAAFLIGRRAKGDGHLELELSNPLNFGVAIRFALIYAAVRWLMHFATAQFGTTGGYVAAVLSGTTDVDAVTLSTARSVGAEVTAPALVTILLAALSNTLAKCIIASVVGTAALRRHIIPGFSAMFLATVAVITWLLLTDGPPTRRGGMDEPSGPAPRAAAPGIAPSTTDLRMGRGMARPEEV